MENLELVISVAEFEAEMRVGKDAEFDLEISLELRNFLSSRLLLCPSSTSSFLLILVLVFLSHSSTKLHSKSKKIFCNFDDCSPFHLLSSFFDPFRRLDHADLTLCFAFLFSFLLTPPSEKALTPSCFHPSFTVNEFQQAPFSLASCVSRSASSFQSR